MWPFNDICRELEHEYFLHTFFSLRNFVYCSNSPSTWYFFTACQTCKNLKSFSMSSWNIVWLFFQQSGLPFPTSLLVLKVCVNFVPVFKKLVHISPFHVTFVMWLVSVTTLHTTTKSLVNTETKLILRLVVLLAPSSNMFTQALTNFISSCGVHLLLLTLFFLFGWAYFFGFKIKIGFGWGRWRWWLGLELELGFGWGCYKWWLRLELEFLWQ